MACLRRLQLAVLEFYSASAVNEPVRSLLEAHLGQLGFEGRLKLLHISGRRTVPGLLRDQAQPAGLIEIPLCSVPIAESDFTADNCPRASEVIDGYGNAGRRAAGGLWLACGGRW
jgi:hypothetical protein